MLDSLRVSSKGCPQVMGSELVLGYMKLIEYRHGFPYPYRRRPARDVRPTDLNQPETVVVNMTSRYGNNLRDHRAPNESKKESSIIISLSRNALFRPHIPPKLHQNEQQHLVARNVQNGRNRCFCLPISSWRYLRKPCSYMYFTHYHPTSGQIFSKKGSSPSCNA